MGMRYENLEEPNLSDTFLFNDKSIRRVFLAFIRKVYSIVLAQLVVTCAFIAIFVYVPEVGFSVKQNPALMIIPMVSTFVILLVLICCESVRRKWPANIIVLSIFTLLQGWLLGAVSSFYGRDEVLIAIGITAVVVFALTVFAFQTKWDFTASHAILFTALIILMVFGILCMFIRSRILHLVYASLGALVFSIYLVFDTQMMMGENHKYSLSPEEYIFAALTIYLDIINLFLYILQIVNEASRN